MYLNGNLTSTNSETTPINVDAQTSIGRHGILDMRYFDGSIDEFKLYQSALTEEEISTEYNDILDNIVVYDPNIAIRLVVPSRKLTPQSASFDKMSGSNNTAAVSIG